MFELAATDGASLIGSPLSNLIPGKELQETETGRPTKHAVQLPDGRTMPVEILCRTDRDRREGVVTIRDISGESMTKVQVEWMARLDPLTGLANRALFERQLDQALALSDRRKIGAALLYVDLDRFESFNEAPSHHAAEEVLIETARRLRGCVRDSDTVARVGWDEFVIIQALTEQALDAAALADRIVREMTLPFSVDHQPIAVTASVGVALYPADGSGPRNLIKNAVMAVRQAKNDGRGRWRYFEPAWTFCSGGSGRGNAICSWH